MFRNAESKLQLMQNLGELRTNLIELGEIPYGMDIYDYSVKFFDIVAKFQDANIVSDDVRKSFKNDEFNIVMKHVANSGRNQYGWVRAERGQKVTLDNLYLGDIAGIWTFPASKFKAMPDDKYVQDNIQNQLRRFITSHRQPMIDAIAKLLGKEKTPNMFLTMFAKTNKTTAK